MMLILLIKSGLNRHNGFLVFWFSKSSKSPKHNLLACSPHGYATTCQSNVNNYSSKSKACLLGPCPANHLTNRLFWAMLLRIFEILVHRSVRRFATQKVNENEVHLCPHKSTKMKNRNFINIALFTTVKQRSADRMISESYVNSWN